MPHTGPTIAATIIPATRSVSKDTAHQRLVTCTQVRWGSSMGWRGYLSTTTSAYIKLFELFGMRSCVIVTS